MAVRLLAPLSGRLVALEELPDPVFAEKMLGDGIAIEPTSGEVRSPIDATVEMLFPTGHAIGLKTAEGYELLIHIGIESVKHPGLFQTMVAAGASVKAGDLLIRFDLAGLRSKAASSLTPVIITAGADEVQLTAAAPGTAVQAGVDVILTLA